MLRFSKKTLYAIESVLDIAYHAGSKAVQSREITRRQCIPRRYLEQALQQLVRGGILIGVRGPRGGYRLARERRRISVGDIVTAMRTLETDHDRLNGECGSELGQKIIQPLWAEIGREIIDRLNAISIDDLCTKADAIGITSEGRMNLDFTI